MLHLIGNLRNNLQCRNGQSGACIAFTHNATGALRYVLNQVFFRILFIYSYKLLDHRACETEEW